MAKGGLGLRMWSDTFLEGPRAAVVRRAVVFLVFIVLAGASAALLHSCTSSSRTIVAPPQIAGAEFVGSKACAECHAEYVREFPNSTHALLKATGKNAAEIGCESCHGPGSLHNDSAGERGTIVNPKRDPAICFECHIGAKADFALPHAHPATKGPLGLATVKIGCADCHNPHGGAAVERGADALLAVNDGCVSCHPAQRGPFVFEHEAMREGCVSCHQPHGSINPNLLTERNANLCLKCHMQPQLAENTLGIGGRDHSFFMSQGTCSSAGCHEAVHGSQVSPSLRF